MDRDIWDTSVDFLSRPCPEGIVSDGVFTSSGSGGTWSFSRVCPECGGENISVAATWTEGAPLVINLTCACGHRWQPELTCDPQ